MELLICVLLSDYCVHKPKSRHSSEEESPEQSESVDE